MPDDAWHTAYDDAFDDERLAALYDRLNPWRPDNDFYLALVHSAASVLDVGCGTGTLLARARADGHTGHLCGLDPAPGMPACARRHPGIAWHRGTAAQAAALGPFDLAVMTGHAFQVLLTDEEIAASLRAIRGTLKSGGRFAFETRNPLAKAWERWTPEHAVTVTDDAGSRIRVHHEVIGVSAGHVDFTETYTSADWAEPRVSSARLRFLTAREVDAHLAGAGFTVTEQYGDWERGSPADTAAEIITVATVV